MIGIESQTRPVDEAAAPSDWPVGWCAVMTHTHTYSGRSDHGGTCKPPESYQRLADWTRRQGIGAVGMGSPYTVKSAANYGRFDGRERDLYYSGDFDPLTVLDADELESMIAQMAECSAGTTLFYLDNETPKGRYGHMWWLGYHADMPAWHDYDQPYDRWMIDANRPEQYESEPMPYERRPYLKILGIQRSHGALGFWAHPTSWWRGATGQFITNIASEMPVHLMADGYLDGLVVMGYHPFRPQYLDLWHELLDRGYRVPAVAEMDSGLSDPALWERDDALLTYARGEHGALTTKGLVDAFKTSRLIVSSGPFVDLNVDDQEMGQTLTTSADTAHRVRITAYPKPGSGPLGRIELVGRGGKVIWSKDQFKGGTVEILVPGLDQRGYFIARAFGADCDVRAWRAVKHFATSNPVYLHPRGQSFNAPATTRLELTIDADSRFVGGEVRFESMTGETLGTANASGTIVETLPASARLTLVAPDGSWRTDYLANANTPLLDVQRYLYRGRFTRDFPSLQSGEVPPEAWRLDEYAEALRAVQIRR